MRYSIQTTMGIVIVSILLTVSIGYGETRFDAQGDKVAYGARYHEGLYDGYHTAEDGTISVSIDDVAYLLHPEAILRSAQKAMMTLEQFVPGSAVKFFEVEGEITKMWVSEDQDQQGENLSNRQGSEDSNNLSPDSSGGEGDLKLEDGVWTN